MTQVYEVIDRETGKPVTVRSLYDSNGEYKPNNPDWQAMYYLREPGTLNEIQIKPATVADEIDDIADEFHCLADRLREIADRQRGVIDDE